MNNQEKLAMINLCAAADMESKQLQYLDYEGAWTDSLCDLGVVMINIVTYNTQYRVKPEPEPKEIPPQARPYNINLWKTSAPPVPELTQKQIVLAQMVVELLPVYSTTDNGGTPYTIKGVYESNERNALEQAKRILEACKDD